MKQSAAKKSILFVHNDNPAHPLSSFFQHDLEILKKQYDVRVLSLFPFKHGYLDAMLSLSVWKMVAGCDAVFGWFGSCAPITIMASLLGKPSVIIAGGADVVYVPEIGYGLNPKHRVSYSLFLLGYSLARRVLLFSQSSRRDFLRLPGMSAAKARTMYLGVDTGHFCMSGKKKNHVLSVSYISESSIRRKGILTLMETARLTPEISYRIGGLVIDQSALGKIVDSAPPNVTFLGYLDDAQLLSELQSAKLYAQLSYHEGFGMAVAEAMACGCIPVVTDRGSIPEVVGECGFYVPVEDPVPTAAAIREAMAADDSGLGIRARARIMELFLPALRERGVLAVMREVLKA